MEENNTSAIVRQVKIDMITDTPSPIIVWFDSIWNQLSVAKIDVFHSKGTEIIYYIDGEYPKFIFYIDTLKRHFACHSDYYWNLNHNLNINDDTDKSEITKYLFSYYYKHKVSESMLKVMDRLDICITEDGIGKPEYKFNFATGNVTYAIYRFKETENNVQ